MRFASVPLILLAVVACHGAPAGVSAALQPVVLDSFESAVPWTAAPSDGVSLRLSTDSGFTGQALRLDFDFNGHGGYAVAHRTLALELPDNYAFSFRIRGLARPNNLEFKLIDSTGDNVWWVNQRDFNFSQDWTEVTLRKRRISFAWGPRGGGDLHHLAALEFAITAGQGGRGTVWIDQLTLTPLPPEHPYAGTPRLDASSAIAGHPAGAALDGDTTTWWHSAAGADTATLSVDFGEPREFGGLILDWMPDDFAAAYALDASRDAAEWKTLYRVQGGSGGRDYLWLPESDARYLRLRLQGSSRGTGYGLREVLVQPLAFGDSINHLFEAEARDAPRGDFPRYLTGEQTYWTVVGVSGGRRVALLNTDGALEPSRGGFSIEPFIYIDGHLVTWHDVHSAASLARGDLPIPSVRWNSDSFSLTTTAFAAGGTSGGLYARYRFTNRSSRPLHPRLFLAIRPLQVNPPWQFLGTPGGAASIRRITETRGHLQVDGTVIVPVSPPGAVGVAAFGRGDIVTYLRRDTLPARHSAENPCCHTSGALAYDLTVGPGDSADVWIQLPTGSETRSPAHAEALEDSVAARWSHELNRVGLSLGGGGAEVVRTLRSNLAYILIERDGPAFQPGTRSYARTWIRDGAMMSAALLRLGHAAEVRDFIEWFAPYQYPSGKIPCCVDRRGADPVPENDSNGEFIFLVADYLRMTGDTALASEMWPRVKRAAWYIDSLRTTNDSAAGHPGWQPSFAGLVPASISHEGYSAKPMHSYWDDLWALAGLRNASELGRALGDSAAAAEIGRSAAEMASAVARSVRLATASHTIGYVPGSAELGDFDPTSTTIALAPTGTADVLPDSALRQTFQRYWEQKAARESGDSAWENYTPYELRNIGAFVRLGWAARAQQLLSWFLADRRPAAWKQWAEVVWRDSTAPRFIGDMPHAWVGSDYIRSVLDMLAYVRSSDGALVVGAAIAPDWLTGGGVRVDSLRTPYGPLSYRMWVRNGVVRVRLSRGVRVPKAGIVIVSPVGMRARRVTVRRLPASITFR